jgi:hypothetical protein
MRFDAHKILMLAALLAGASATSATWAQPAAKMSTKPIPTSAIPMPALRSRAEQIYSEVREALAQQNYERFMELTLPAGSGKPPPKAVFDQIALRLMDDYPVLESLTFARIERSGDWIGYYAENRIADPKRTFIYFFRFKRVDNDLKMSGRIVIKDIPQVKEQFRTTDEIALNPIFRLPGQKGYQGKD